MCIYDYILQIVLLSALSLSFISCGGNRVHIEFKTPKDIFVNERTDTDKLNKELEQDIREAEKKRLERKREEEAAQEHEHEKGPARIKAEIEQE